MPCRHWPKTRGPSKGSPTWAFRRTKQRTERQYSKRTILCCRWTRQAFRQRSARTPSPATPWPTSSPPPSLRAGWSTTRTQVLPCLTAGARFAVVGDRSNGGVEVPARRLGIGQPHQFGGDHHQLDVAVAAGADEHLEGVLRTHFQLAHQDAPG